MSDDYDQESEEEKEDYRNVQEKSIDKSLHKSEKYDNNFVKSSVNE